jgi:hypothetical protein
MSSRKGEEEARKYHPASTSKRNNVPGKSDRQVATASPINPGELPGKEQKEVHAEEQRKLPVDKQEEFIPIQETGHGRSLSYPVFTPFLPPQEWHLNAEDRGPVGSVHVLVIGKYDVIPDDCYPTSVQRRIDIQFFISGDHIA